MERKTVIHPVNLFLYWLCFTCTALLRNIIQWDLVSGWLLCGIFKPMMYNLLLVKIPLLFPTVYAVIQVIKSRQLMFEYMGYVGCTWMFQGFIFASNRLGIWTWHGQCHCLYLDWMTYRCKPLVRVTHLLVKMVILNVQLKTIIQDQKHLNMHVF